MEIAIRSLFKLSMLQNVEMFQKVQKRGWLHHTLKRRETLHRHQQLLCSGNNAGQASQRRGSSGIFNPKWTDRCGGGGVDCTAHIPLTRSSSLEELKQSDPYFFHIITQGGKVLDHNPILIHS